MHHSNHPILLVGSGVAVLAAAVVTASIFTRRYFLKHRWDVEKLDDEMDPKHPSNMEYLVSHNGQGF